MNLVTIRSKFSSSGLLSSNPAQELIHSGHAAFLFVVENTLPVDQEGQISRGTCLDPRLNPKLFPDSLLQAHGCTAKVHSKETAFDFYFHGNSLNPWRPGTHRVTFYLRRFLRRWPRCGAGSGIEQADGLQDYVTGNL